MFHKYILLIIFIPISLFTTNIDAQDSLLEVIVIAGQSNALNWHSDASLLDANIIDSAIKFYYHTGLPPNKADTLPFNSTSDNQWTTLSYQTQNPYVKYYKNFFGPEITLARELYTSHPNIAVIKCAYGGSNLAVDWKKGIGSGNQLYELMMDQIKIATNILNNIGSNYKFIGFFWMQGESDASNLSYANEYETNLLNLIQNLRVDLNSHNLKFVLGRIGINLPSPYDYKQIVRTAQINVANSDSLVEWIDIDDLPLDTDNIHLLAEGVKTLGTRMAKGWKNTLSNIDKSGKFLENNYTLMQNFPNPFNPITTIEYYLPKSSLVKLSVYDMLGRQVEILVDEEKPRGSYKVEFDANSLSSGVYFYQLQTNEFSKTKKFLLLN